MKIENFIRLLSKTNPRSTFVSLKGYKNDKGEKSNYNIVFHADYRTAVEKSIIQMVQFVPQNNQQKQIKEEILDSLRTSLTATDTRYDSVLGANNKPIKGLKQKKNTKELYITGKLVSKQVISSDREVKNVSEKEQIWQNLPVAQFRQFKLTPEKVERIVISNKNVKIG